MKKFFLLVPVATLAMTACTSESNEFVGDKQQAQREITFSPLNQNLTRATTQYAIDGTTFPITQDMYVAAYQVTPTPAGNFFAGTNFTYDGTASTTLSTPVWSGTTKRYWPLTPAYINFLAYANVTGSASFDSTTPASAATITQTDNSSTQTDLLYAIGHGEVTQSDNALTFPTKVDMQFQHAQAWVDFYVKAYSDVEEAIKVNSITLNGASYSGTYTITHNSYNADNGQNVAGAWSLLGAKGKDSSDDNTSVASEVKSGATAVTVPGIAGGGQSLTSSLVQAGKGLMIVPDDDNATADFISFTINYTYDGHDYDYTFTPATEVAANVDQKKHYIYNITFKLHEIYVAATVEDWDDQTATAITISD